MVIEFHNRLLNVKWNARKVPVRIMKITVSVPSHIAFSKGTAFWSIVVDSDLFNPDPDLAF
jgi:hypothetical protein